MPMASGYSPSQNLFGHSLRSFVPARIEYFAPPWQKKRRHLNRIAFNKSKTSPLDPSAHSLRPLKRGEFVRLQKPSSKQWDEVGQVIERIRNKSYAVKLNSGTVRLRNRKFLRPFLPSISPPLHGQQVSELTQPPIVPQPAAIRTSPTPPLRTSARARKRPQRLVTSC